MLFTNKNQTNMKKNVMNLACAAAVAALLSSCAFTAPVTATSNEVGSKVGVAKTTRVFAFFFDGGDASIQTAAKNGGIKKISTVDFKTSVGFLGLFGTFQTIVTGE